MSVAVRYGEYADIQKSLYHASSMDDVQAHLNDLRETAASIQAMAKAQGVTASQAPPRGPKSVFFDPLSLQYAMGYKDRRYSLTYDTLKRIAHQVGVVAAIIATRQAQIASFSEPYRLTKSLGFQVKHKSPDHLTSDAEREFIEYLESFVANCGEPGRQNPFTRMKRPKFEQFLKMIVRDTLTFDQIGFEVIPRRDGIPFEFWAVDATTLRIASPDRDAGMHFSYHHRNPIGQMQQPHRFANMYDRQVYGETEPLDGNPIRYVQVVNGQIENVYAGDELAFGVRNPRSDIYIQGYGYGELEQLITIITSILYAEEYNRRFFQQGAHPKGMLNFKGDNWTPDQLEAFKRQWIAQVAGTENAWKTPITQSEGVEWIDLQRSNQEMGYQGWLEYNIKLACGVFLIDPAEINFDLHGGVQQTPLFESSQEWKLKASRDRGLKPLLKFIARLINEYVIDKIDDHFVFEFAGLDELTEQEKHELIKEQIGSYKTLNEARRELDLPELEDELGDIPLNPTLIQLLQMQQSREDQMRQEKKEEEQQKKEEEQQQQQQMMEQQGGGEEQPPPEEPLDPKQEQELRHAEDKHPLELQLLQQKLAQQGGEMPMPQEAAMAPGDSPEQMPPEDMEMLPEEQQPPPPPQRNTGNAHAEYAALIGKSVSFDDFIDFMRSRK